jgi:hypothetical protein
MIRVSDGGGIDRDNRWRIDRLVSGVVGVRHSIAAEITELIGTTDSTVVILSPLR